MHIDAELYSAPGIMGIAYLCMMSQKRAPQKQCVLDCLLNEENQDVFLRLTLHSM